MMVDNLPSELIQLIFLYLTVKDILNLKLTSVSFRGRMQHATCNMNYDF